MKDKEKPRKKNKSFIVRLSTADKIRLENQATAANLSMSSYVRTKLLNNNNNNKNE